MTLFGYDFRNGALAAEALTTPSCRMSDRGVRDNQRLEFLGDAVLDLLAAERLYDALPEEREGSLTVRRTHMVSSAALCAAAVRCGLVPLLRRAKGLPPPSPHEKTLADAVEAVIGAAYVDGGLEAARTVFAALGLEEKARDDEWSANRKGELQVRAQAMKPPRHPAYELVGVGGKSHEPVFTVRVSVDGVGEATASAGSRQEAEQRAAAALLARCGG